MKRIKMFIMSLLLMLPIMVFASGSVELDKTSLTIDEGGSATFTINATNAAGRVTINSNNTSIATVNKSNEWVENQTITVTVNGLKSGSTSISVNINAATFDEIPIKTTKTVSVTVKGQQSSNNNLSDLKVDGTTISGFSSSKTSYNLNVDKSSVNITASIEDTKASVSGTGVKNLNYGNNNIGVTVTAENGSKKTYTIVINRKDNRSTNNNLSDLKVDGTTISGFSSSKTSYNLNVDKSSVNITASVEDTKASVSGTGVKNLNYGNNNIGVTVTAENGSKKTYTIVINRKDNRSTNNNLSDLKVDGTTISGFSSNKTSYNLNVDKSSVNITASIEDTKASVSGTGVKNLNYGNNNIGVTVTAENGSKKTYTIVINRKDNRSTNNNLSSLSISNGNISFNKNTTSYSVEVDDSINEINIQASSEDSKSKVSGTGVKKLVAGTNEFKIIVTAENGTTKTYTIKIIKKGNEIVDNNSNSQTRLGYLVEYDEDSAKYCSSNTQGKSVNENDIIGELCTPEKDGYRFDGWVDQDGNPVTSETRVTKSLTLRARFSKIEKNDSQNQKSDNSLIFIIIVVVLTLILGLLIGHVILRKKSNM